MELRRELNTQSEQMREILSLMKERAGICKLTKICLLAYIK